MSPIRFTGMASGLDTEKMIKDLMKAHREPVNRLVRKKQTDEWKRDTYREMNALLDQLKKSVETIRYSSNFNKKIALSGNEDIISAKAVGKPQFSSYLVEVLNPAKEEVPASAKVVLNGVTSVDAQLGAEGTIKVNNTTITIEATDSISSIIQQVKQKDPELEVGFVNGALVFTSKPGVVLEDPSAPTDPSQANDFFHLDFSGLSTPGKIVVGSSDVRSTTRIAGEDATVNINGIEYKFKSNSFTFDGIDFTIKDANPGSPITVNTKTDEDSIFNLIKGFVDTYNDVIDKINKKISEPKYRSYKPLLDEEKEALPEKTAEKLEGMAKSGILLRDPILKAGLDQMRYAISSPLKVTGVNERFDTLSEIGVGGPPSGKYAYQENGKLYIDETKLREAIRNNGEDVLKLFTNFSNSDNPDTKFNESGVAERLYSQLTKVMDKVTKEAGSAFAAFDDSAISRSIRDTDKEIDRWEDRLKMIEDRYWKQFTAMEKAMAKFQSQGSWFAQMFGQQ